MTTIRSDHLMDHSRSDVKPTDHIELRICEVHRLRGRNIPIASVGFPASQLDSNSTEINGTQEIFTKAPCD